MIKLTVSESPIAGRGLFVAQAVKKGGFIQFIKGTVRHKINKTEHDALANPNWIGITRNRWLDPASPFKFINHSCNPSCSIRGRTKLVALRDMQRGDEVTIDYSLTEEDPRWYLRCSCGAKHCRKMVRAIQHLPLNSFKAYQPNVPTHFRSVYLRAHENGLRGNR